MTKKAPAAAAATPHDDADELLAQIADPGAKLVISEYANGRVEYLEQLEDLDQAKSLGVEEFLKQRYGGGRYLVRVRRGGKFGKGRVVPIAGEPKPRETIAAAVTTPATSSSAWEKVAMVAVGAFATALAPAIVKKMLEGPPPAPDRVDELLKLAAILKPGSNADPVTQMTAMLTMMRELKSFQGELEPAAGGGGDRGGSGFLSLLTDNVPRVIHMIERGLDQREARMSRRLPGATAPATNPTGTGGADRAAVAGATGGAANDAGGSDPLAAMLQRIPIPARSMLHQWAKQDLDPEFYADVVLDQFDDATYQAFAEQLPREDFVDVLLATIPAFQSHRDWFTRLVVAMRASVGGHSGAEVPEQPGGDAERGNSSSSPAAPAQGAA